MLNIVTVRPEGMLTTIPTPCQTKSDGDQHWCQKVSNHGAITAIVEQSRKWVEAAREKRIVRKVAK